MNRGRQDLADRRPAPDVPDVVAGLLPGGSAGRVARAAVREAVGRGARIRFLQIMAAGSDPARRDRGDADTFAAALRALRERPDVPVSFEVVDGDAGPALVDRSRGAGLLIVGADDPETTTALAHHCNEHAACDVLVVRPALAGALH